MESQPPKSFASWSAIVRYAVISAINLAILLVGMALGVMLAPHIEKTASAAHPAEQQASQPPVATSGVETANPQMTVGTVGIYLVLAHHIQSDELVVNGIDLLKLHQEEINLLSRFVPPQDISAAIKNAKDTKLYQLPPTPPAATTTPKPSPK